MGPQEVGPVPYLKPAQTPDQIHPIRSPPAQGRLRREAPDPAPAETLTGGPHSRICGPTCQRNALDMAHST
ncbi:hypothetical protein E2562_000869 [Oryza meyeriana var. granulata]|uniref:Uncharacterized protein n=1 Tax=Oryza meyeriana var. granulata TaxID=110450 RepID=A0A6G1CY59_9ORYZ|nr:hypothetical protein E2562_000869 [Oryza meyeriana var. granulata]